MDPEPTRKIPGYTGFLRGSQHTFGKTFGNASSDCKTMDASALVVPSMGKDPFVLESSPITGFPEGKYHIPGYGGHVRGERDNYFASFGDSTRKQFGGQSQADIDINHRPIETDPLPGYGGFVPHAKDDFGRRFGEVKKSSYGEFHPNAPKVRPGSSGSARGSTPGGAEVAVVTSKKRPNHMPGKYPKPAVPANGDHNLPGYGGHVEHNSDVTGLTYGEGTRRVKSGDPHLVNEALDHPEARGQVIVGYKGFVPGLKSTIGRAHPDERILAEEKENWRRQQSDARPSSSASNKPKKRQNMTALVAERAANAAEEAAKEKRIPGYSGFVRGGQNAFGRTFGQATHNLLTTGRGDVESGEVPETNPIPGYGGFMPNSKDICETNFGGVAHQAYNPGKREHTASQFKTRYTNRFAGEDPAQGNNPLDASRQFQRSFYGDRPGTPSDRRSSTGSNRPDSRAWSQRAASRGGMNSSQSAPMPDGEQFTDNKRIPGYGGFVRGKQHVFGKTYGETIDHSGDVYHERVPDFDRSLGKHEQEMGYSFDGHIPGYMGFIRDMKDTCGRSYGDVTGEKLKEFARGKKDRPESQASMRPESKAESRSASAPLHRPGTTSPGPHTTMVDGKVVHIPGYTGFQRGHQHVFGKTFGDSSKILKPKGDNPNGYTSRPPTYAPTAQKNPYAYSYSSASRLPTPDSVKLNPKPGVPQTKRYHIPGYGGFVAHTRDHHARTFGQITSTVLGGSKAPRNNPDKVGDHEIAPSQLPVPGYAGHLRHSKDTFGKTFQDIAKSGVEQSTTHKPHTYEVRY